jgi:hypothetical protein
MKRQYKMTVRQKIVRDEISADIFLSQYTVDDTVDAVAFI